MNITRQDIDSLNAVVTVDIAKEDYSDKVEKILKDYRKTANIPGFRKGQVPMGMVKKQYGKAVLVDEVNKLLDQALNKYLTEEKLDVLGNPLPKEQNDFDWDADNYKFEFELGLTPEFEIDLQPKKAITSYKITADDKMVDNQITRIQKQYGKLESKDVVEDEDTLVAGTFKNEEEGIDNTTTLPLEKVKGKTNLKKFIGTKVGDTISLKTKGLFEDDHDLMEFLKVEHDKAHGLDIPVEFTITEANKQIPADLDQELFDKLFGKDVVKTVTEMKAKIKEDAEQQFKQQSDQQLLNDISEHFIENTKFDLPGEFLARWIKATAEEDITEEQSKEEYEKSEKGLRFQLIEAKLVNDNKLNVSFEDLKAFAKDRIKMQMAQFGQMNPTDEELEGIAARVLGNQDEVKRMTEQLMNERLLGFYKENVKLKEKSVTYEEFVKEVYE